MNLSRLLSKVISTSVFWTVMVTCLRFLGFIIIIPIVLKELPSEEVGLWYIFLNIVSFSALVDMGFCNIVSRFTCYYLAGLQELPSLSALEIPPPDSRINYAGLAGLQKMARRLYVILSVIVFFAMAAGAIWLYVKYHSAFEDWRTLLSFSVMTLAAVWSMAGMYWSGILLGLNRVRQYQKAVLVGVLGNYLTILLGMSLHWGILALALGQVVLSLYQRERARYLCQKALIQQGDEAPLPIKWHHLWPMTWRGGLMGLGLNLSFGATTLVCAQLFDLKQAASYALSFQLVTMVSVLASSWVFVQLPIISELFVKKRYSEIKSFLIIRLSLQTFSYVIICLIAINFAPLILSRLGAKTQFLEPHFLGLLMLVGGLDLFVNTFSSIVQCGNQFPFVKTQLTNGLLNLVLAYVLGKRFGMGAVIAAPLLAQLTFNGWYMVGWCWRHLNRPVLITIDNRLDSNNE